MGVFMVPVSDGGSGWLVMSLFAAEHGGVPWFHSQYDVSGWLVWACLLPNTGVIVRGVPWFHSQMSGQACQDG
jgi:hypothetical protein